MGEPEGWISLWLNDQAQTLIVVPSAAFDKPDIAAILAFLQDPGNTRQDVIRGLKALGTLAYQTPAQLGERMEVLSVVLALMKAYPAETNLQIAAIHTLGNMADDPEIAREKFSEVGILSTLVGTMVRIPAENVCKQVTETIARIVTAWEEHESSVLPRVLRVIAVSQQGQSK